MRAPFCRQGGETDDQGRPLCSGHAEPMKARGDGRWQCSVNRKASTRQRGRRRLANGDLGNAFAQQLQRGEVLMWASNHHRGMAAWKEELGDPRPDGLTLSRVCLTDCPDGYAGWQYSRGKRAPYRLCMNPDHYTWETLRDNLRRRFQDA